MNSTKPWLSWATATALGAALVTGSGPLGAPAASARQQSEADAVAQARRTGQAVEIVARRTATTEIYANPSGSYTLKQYAQPARLRSDDTPSVTAVNNFNWTHINQANANTSYWTSDRNQAKVGYSGFSTQKTPWRSFFLFDVPAELAGAQIVHGAFSITLDHSSSCGPTGVLLYGTANVSSAAPVTWNNSSSGATWNTPIGTQFGNASQGGGCGTDQPDMAMYWSSDSMPALLSQLQAAANGALGSQMTFGLRAVNETDKLQWKLFYPFSAALVIEYNPAPNAPAGL